MQCIAYGPKYKYKKDVQDEVKVKSFKKQAQNTRSTSLNSYQFHIFFNIYTKI